MNERKKYKHYGDGKMLAKWKRFSEKVVGRGCKKLQFFVEYASYKSYA